MFIKNIWYVAGWSSEVDDGTLLDRTIAGERIVFFRKASGAIAALHNRCCHRSALLSLGQREGDGIRCGYHGIKFDAEGKCVDIPGQKLIPSKAFVDRFPVVEQQGWIWVWPGDASKADPALIPRLKLMGDPGWKMRTGYLPYETHYQLLHDNLLDFSHISYVHRATFGGGSTAWADILPVLARRENGFSFERWMENQVVPPFIANLIPPDTRQDIFNVYEFYLPGVLVIDTSTQAAGTGTREKMAADLMRSVSWQAVTPATETSSHYFFSAGVENHVPTEVMDVIFQGTEAAFEEDRLMIGAQQDILWHDSRGPQISVIATAHDGPLLQLRAMIKRLVEAEVAPGATL